MTTILRVRTTISGWQGGPGLDTCYYSPGTAGGSTADATDVCTRVRAFFSAAAANYATTVGFQVSGSVDALDDATGTLVGGYSGGSPSGTGGSGTASSYVPFEVAIGLRLQTGVVIGGRRLLGRKFMSPCTTSVNTGGVPTAAAGNLFITAAAQLISGSTTSQLVVWKRPTGSLAGSSHPVTGFQVSGEFWSLRSRRD